MASRSGFRRMSSSDRFARLSQQAAAAAASAGWCLSKLSRQALARTMKMPEFQKWRPEARYCSATPRSGFSVNDTTSATSSFLSATSI